MPIALISTLDTKGREVAYLKSFLKELGRSVVVIDVGLGKPDGVTPEISRFEVAEAVGTDLGKLASRQREEVMATMGSGAGEILHRLWAQAELSGVLGLGGNQGTAVVCAAMRELPLGVPKFVLFDRGLGRHAPLYRVHRYRRAVFGGRFAGRPEPGDRNGAAKRGGGDCRNGRDLAACGLIRQAFGGNHFARKHPSGGGEIGGNFAGRGTADCGFSCLRGLWLGDGKIDSRRTGDGGAGAYAA